MSVDAFLESIANSKKQSSLPAITKEAGHAPETIDALFHLPLLALAVMMIARRNPFRTTFLGSNVAVLLVEHFSALRRSPKVLETSITLRRRCADALAFLEAAKMVEISSDQQRIVALSDEGNRQLVRASRDETDLGLLVRRLRISQERAIARSGNDR